LHTLKCMYWWKWLKCLQPSAIAVEGGYRDWLYRVDTGTGCTGWIQGLAAGLLVLGWRGNGGSAWSYCSPVTSPEVTTVLLHPPEVTAVLLHPPAVTAVLLHPLQLLQSCYILLKLLQSCYIPQQRSKQYASSQYRPLLSLTFTTKHVFVSPNPVIESIQLHGVKKHILLLCQG
jgi:hypothetical protein